MFTSGSLKGGFKHKCIEIIAPCARNLQRYTSRLQYKQWSNLGKTISTNSSLTRLKVPTKFGIVRVTVFSWHFASRGCNETTMCYHHRDTAQKSCTIMAPRGEHWSAEVPPRSLISHTHPNRRYSSTVHISKCPSLSFVNSLSCPRRVTVTSIHSLP
jgi:hypothetical protein